MSLKFDSNGLLPAIVQDAANGEVLMVAYMNAEAVAKTFETGLVHFYSRSRKELWFKGGASGHTQAVKEVRLDCDGDAILLKVEQKGGACHEGYRSCFFRILNAAGGLRVTGSKVFEPEAVYGKKAH